MPNLSKRSRAATIVPSSVNVEKRTVDVTFATSNPVRTWDWELGYYMEILKFGKDNVRSERINSRAPLLNSHNPDDQIGVVEPNTIIFDESKGEARATVRFSKNPKADEKFNDVVDGILANISVGYWVYAYDLVRQVEGELSEYEAVDWEPCEISTVSIPADYKAGTRAKDKTDFNEVKINTRMPKETTPAKTPATKTTTEDPKGGEPTPDTISREAVVAERKRCVDIREAVRAANLADGEELIDSYIDKGYSIGKVRKLILKRFAEAEPEGVKGGAHVAVTVNREAIDQRRAAMEEYFLHRVAPGKNKVDKSRHLAGFTLLELARYSCEAEGISTVGMDRKDIAKTALGLKRSAYGGMTNSDFPFVLGNVFHKLLLEQYVLLPRTFTTWARQSRAVDFRQNLRIRISDLASMPEIKEGAEYTSVALTDNQEKYIVKKYGYIVPISWEAIINDDLNAFSRMPSAIAAAAAQTQSDIVYNLLLSNPTLQQNSNALFSTANGNIDSVGAALAITSLQAGRQAVRSQKSMAGKYLDLSPKILLVSPYNEVASYQLTSNNYTPIQPSNINPEFFKTLQPIVEPRLLGDGNSGKSWYLMCEPGIIDTIEYAFLEGEGELFTEQQWNFEKDQYELKARMVFGAGAIDYRGMYKNVGA